MRLKTKLAAFAVVVLLVAPLSFSAVVSGTVKEPDGQPFEGAFVSAQNSATKITVDVLSGKDGRFRIEKLPAGTYDLRIRAVGYKSDPKTGVSLAADQNAPFDFGLQKIPWFAGAT